MLSGYQKRKYFLSKHEQYTRSVRKVLFTKYTGVDGKLLSSGAIYLFNLMWSWYHILKIVEFWQKMLKRGFAIRIPESQVFPARTIGAIYEVSSKSPRHKIYRVGWKSSIIRSKIPLQSYVILISILKNRKIVLRFDRKSWKLICYQGIKNIRSMRAVRKVLV